MLADFSLELASEDHALEIPWSSPDGAQRYFNLKQQPELLLDVMETADNRDLAEFLVALNAPNSVVETAKCDTWLSDEIHPEEEIFGAAWKFGAYVDVVFSELALRASLPAHENLARMVATLLSSAPDLAAAADFVVRRCYSHTSADPEQSDDGYCVTVYVNGFGDQEEDAQKNWVIGLKLVQNALMQALAQQRRLTAGPG
jgi:hypothetical protein